MSYAGGCHCGAVTFEVAGDPPTRAISCNCSHCQAKGLLLAFVPADRVTVTGADALETYRFHKHAIEHRFCPRCGVQPFAGGRQPDGAATCAINLRAVFSIDLDTLELTRVDGRSF